MPQFFFHVRDGVSFISDPRSCLPDVAVAQTRHRELMSQSVIGDGRLGIERRFEVTDDQGNTIVIAPLREAIS
jgi:hypothetical protein